MSPKNCLRFFMIKFFLLVLLSGATSGDEMCNLYVMYYSQADARFEQCYDEQSTAISGFLFRKTLL
jgi:hypothetical protein